MLMPSSGKSRLKVRGGWRVSHWRASLLAPASAGPAAAASMRICLRYQHRFCCRQY